jgi:hypothetical protein
MAAPEIGGAALSMEDKLVRNWSFEGNRLLSAVES